MPTNESRTLEVASRLSRLRGAVLPPLDELVRSALDRRPDLAALRFGEKRAAADLAEARANRLTDAYLLSQPYTFGVVRPRSGQVLGQGPVRDVAALQPQSGCNVEQRRINVEQTQAQLAAMERRISDDVEQIYLDCELSLGERSRMERGILADTAKRCDAAEQAYLAETLRGAARRETFAHRTDALRR